MKYFHLFAAPNEKKNGGTEKTKNNQNTECMYNPESSSKIYFALILLLDSIFKRKIIHYNLYFFSDPSQAILLSGSLSCQTTSYVIYFSNSNLGGNAL